MYQKNSLTTVGVFLCPTEHLLPNRRTGLSSIGLACYTASMNTLLVGAIFSDTEWAGIILTGVLGAAILLAVLLYMVFKYAGKKKSFVKVLLAALGVVLALLAVFIAIPAIIEDKRYVDQQQRCAAEAGYKTPAENNSTSATAESQSIYRACLNRS